MVSTADTGQTPEETDMEIAGHPEVGNGPPPLMATEDVLVLDSPAPSAVPTTEDAVTAISR